MATNNNWNNQIAAANSAITLNSGTNAVNISTDSANTTVSVGTGAAVKLVTVGSTNTSSSLALQYGTADFTLASATGTVMNALDTGEITYPLQPAFLVYPTTGDNNVTGDNTAYQVPFGTEIFDRNGDFASNTFTAPVTGVYRFDSNLSFSGITSALTNAEGRFVTSNRSLDFTKLNPYAISVGGAFSACGSTLSDMDAADTATVYMTIAGGTKIADLIGANDGYWTRFSGNLVC